MDIDWKDALSRLRDTVPEASEAEDALPEEKEEKQVRKEALNMVIEKKGRGGKTATVIEGFTCDDDEVAEIAAWLKKKIGVGGSARGGEILLQGDWRVKAGQLLKEKGYKVKGIPGK